MLWRGVLKGSFVLAATLAVYLLTLPISGVESARAQALVALTAANLGLVGLNASLGAGAASVLAAGMAMRAARAVAS
jgi:hypothetical protein